MADANVADAVGPSTATNEEVEQELRQAEENFQQGIQAIKANNLDEAVELFGQVLQTRCQQFGDINIKCASTYFRYGAALFYKAQDEQDVFGSTLQAAAAPEEADAAEEEESEDEKENVDDKGKKPMREEDLPQDQAEGEEEADDSPGSRTDMELAWENLEVAKYIYEHESSSTFAKELADIHSLLADIGMEQESFESAMTDHRRALELLSSILQADDRRLAELHYKMSLTLQYLDQPEEALKAIKTAVKIVESRIDNIKAAPGPSEPVAASAPSGPSTSAGAAEEAAKASVQEGAEAGTADSSITQELADLEGVLEDMYEKVEELQQVLKEHLSTKNALKAAFSQIAGTLGPSQTGQGSSSGAAAPSAVVDLGVVGRGTRRVTPLPLSSGTAGASSLQTSVAQKRLLEDLMGGGPVLNSSTVPAFRSTSSSTSIGFGNSCSSSTAFGGASTFSPGFGVNALQPSNSCWPQPLAAVKKQKTGLAEQSSNAGASSQLASSTGKDAVVVQAGALPQSVKVDSDTATANNSALPAFLQPSSVNATYGKNTADTFNKD